LQDLQAKHPAFALFSTTPRANYFMVHITLRTHRIINMQRVADYFIPDTWA